MHSSLLAIVLLACTVLPSLAAPRPMNWGDNGVQKSDSKNNGKGDQLLGSETIEVPHEGKGLLAGTPAGHRLNLGPIIMDLDSRAYDKVTSILLEGTREGDRKQFLIELVKNRAWGAGEQADMIAKSKVSQGNGLLAGTPAGQRLDIGPIVQDSSNTVYDKVIKTLLAFSKGDIRTAGLMAY